MRIGSDASLTKMWLSFVKATPRGSKWVTSVPSFKMPTSWPRPFSATRAPRLPPPNWLPETDTSKSLLKLPKLAGERHLSQSSLTWSERDRGKRVNVSLCINRHNRAAVGVTHQEVVAHRAKTGWCRHHSKTSESDIGKGVEVTVLIEH